MTSNHYVNYYVNQAGSGIAGYSGIKYQKGHGFFGRLLSSTVMPILKYLGKKVLNTGISVGSDVLAGNNVKDSMKRRMETTGFDMAENAFEKIKNFRKQRGSGRKRKFKKLTTKRTNKKSNKRRRKSRKPFLLQLQALAKGRRTLARKRKHHLK